ncbi:gamma-interferon-responsive lysosomal thiol protein [Rosa sericea]
MASKYSSLAHLLLFICSVLLLPNSSSSESTKVSVDLYYETLCPDCSDFILKHLIKLFDTGLISAVDLNLVPYGNAKLGTNDTITCQHGPSECLLNTVEACAIETWPALNDHFPFIYCVESLVYEHKYPQWESCYEKLGLNSTLIAECYNSGHGKELELKYAAETNALQPPHQYVPWVVVDGQPLYEDYENFLSYVCNAYNGTAMLKGCNEYLNTIQMAGEKPNDPVACKEGKMQALFGRIRSTLTSWMSQVNMAFWM